MPEKVTVQFVVNGRPVACEVEPRRLLSDVIREDLGLTGTHVGCEHGVCGACTVLLNEHAVRSCLLLAVQAEGQAIRTVESLASADGTLHPIQQAFHENHALQCGYCTPGFLITLSEFLQDVPAPTEQEVREAISGNLCRCTGYQNIVKATLQAAERLRSNGKVPVAVDAAPTAAVPEAVR